MLPNSLPHASQVPSQQLASRWKKSTGNVDENDNGNRNRIEMEMGMKNLPAL